MSRRRWGVAALTVGALSASLAYAPANADVETNGHHSYSKTRTVGYFIQWGVYGRNFRVKNLDDSVELGTRNIKVALRRLRASRTPGIGASHDGQRAGRPGARPAGGLP